MPLRLSGGQGDTTSVDLAIHSITPQREIPEKVRRVVEALRAHFGAA
ncbi:MAG: hypothetical protein ACRAUW_05175 [Aeromonas sp.]